MIGLMTKKGCDCLIKGVDADFCTIARLGYGRLFLSGYLFNIVTTRRKRSIAFLRKGAYLIR
ncbi:hypothetical protein J2T61_001459 [Methanocalculus sp. AMF5]|nr:hypothetical protein [Methanocalculus sp. AMF5]